MYWVANLFLFKPLEGPEIDMIYRFKKRELTSHRDSEGTKIFLIDIHNSMSFRRFLIFIFNIFD